MKDNIIVMIFVFVLGGSFFTSGFCASEGPYAGISGNAVFVSDIDIDNIELQFDSGFGIGLIGGYDFGRYRVEGELTYRKNDVDQIEIESQSAGSIDADGDISTTSFMVNGYLDYENKTPITPYVGLGLGISIISFNDITIAGIDFVDDDAARLAAQLSAGLGYSVSDSLIIDLGYRYMITDEIDFEDDSGDVIADDSYKSHNITIGLRVMF